MVCGYGCILRTHRVLGKVVIYVFILGVRMVLFICHLVSFEELMMCTEFFDGLMPWLILMVRGWVFLFFFIMMS